MTTTDETRLKRADLRRKAREKMDEADEPSKTRENDSGDDEKKGDAKSGGKDRKAELEELAQRLADRRGKKGKGGKRPALDLVERLKGK